MSSLVLGPLLRHVDTTTAAIWVETRDFAEVVVRAGEVTAATRTFAAHGHHYALVEVDGLAPGTSTPYTLEVDGEPVWPEPGSDLPAPVIATRERDRPPRLAFGSCRTSVGHDEEGHRTHGVDALRTFALALADGRSRPDLLVFLGDQVYADETTEEMQEFIASRRSLEEPPGKELKDYQEYAHLYRLAWTDPVNRWLLSTVPSLMIFDDHDVRDDWNTSQAWREEMQATRWWHTRIVGALASYWVHQHLGNLSPEERAEDEIWCVIRSHEGDEEYDATALLDAFAERVDAYPDTYRWSHAHDLGPSVRLVVVDSRAARVLEEDRRSMLDDAELEWLDGLLTGDVDHLLIGTSLPFLLAPGLHHSEAWSEALTGGAWGRRWSRVGERLRQGVDLEHWAAFQATFTTVAEAVLEVARGQRGRAPTTVTFLSGDVHHSYVSRARPAEGPPGESRILQAVCSPIRNPLPWHFRFATAVASYAVAGPLGHLVARSAKVPKPPLRWKLTEGPWFDNTLATLDVEPDGLRLRWLRGEVEDGRHDRPRLVTVADVRV